MTTTNVLIVGAAGQTGASITNSLLEFPTEFEITALLRPASADKPENVALKERGVKLAPADLQGPQDELIKLLSGIDVVISAIGPTAQLDQIPLATAAKAAGVKRFIPCGFITVAPPKGVMWLRDQKEDVYNHIRELSLPYTIIDVGWWFQVAVPRVPSGRVDYAVMNPDANAIIGDGDQLSGLTDLRDVGRYVARIIVDPRTLNKMVFAYNELLTQDKIFKLMGELSGEKIERTYLPAAEIHSRVDTARKAMKEGSTDALDKLMLYTSEYCLSWGLRGDNTPEYAKFLGYVTSKELYPDFNGVRFEDYLREVLEGKAKRVYPDLKFPKS
ncbi:hypothetical protein N7471_002224 [Penicillium samsonianum]|uniref:uncharacterized protein n=1 Tax=Penicillium samsonianum TaxID=1882272 RepID=UPI002547A426|nr:uncharacterized protein N7471_002224 [Penicillium samsonianum]KAJ6142771.1 hypothetical protein N7471_002224 [Penicillium samsonianum]